MTDKIKCKILWSTEEEEEGVLQENCIDSTVYSWEHAWYAFGVTWVHGSSLIVISPALVVYEEVCLPVIGNSCINGLDTPWESIVGYISGVTLLQVIAT